MKTAMKVFAGIALVLGFLYALLVSNLLKKPPSYALSMATDIASGRLLAEEGYDWDRSKTRLNNQSGCKGIVGSFPNTPIPYSLCIAIRENDFEGCGLWSDESSCVSLEANAFLLDEPERLGRVVDALARPCRYLPAPAEIDANAAINAGDREYMKEAARFVQ